MRIPEEHKEFAATGGIHHTHVPGIEGDEFHKISMKFEGVPRRDKTYVAEIKRN